MEEQKKNYAEMSMEELKSELSFAEMEAKQEKKLLDKAGFFTPEYTARKADYDATQGEINAIKSEIFGRNQKEALSKLNDTSKSALEEYYQFQTEGPGTAKNVMQYIGLYDGYARQKDTNALKENAMNALEAQGISKEEFPKMYEYYKFQRDAERAAANTAELKETYENSGSIGKTAMNVETVLNAPIRGLAASTEALASLTYEDEYAPLNINAPSYDMVNFTDTIRSETVKDIDSGAGKFLYQTGMSVADFGATVPLTALPGGQAAALASMGMNAGTSAAKEATIRGVSKEQALTTGLTSAAIEVATEKVPLDNYISIFKNGGNAAANIAKQAGIEGTEEMIAEVGNTLADNYINGDQSQFNQNVQFYINTGMTQEAAQKYAYLDTVKGVGLSFLGGALSGGVTGTGAQFANYMTTGMDNKLQTEEMSNQTMVIQQNYNTVDDILDFVDNWRSEKGIPEDVELSEQQIGEFVKELHGKIEKMDFSVPAGTTVIGYSGSHGIDDENPQRALGAWKIARDTSKLLGDKAMYISDLSAGKLLTGETRQDLEESIKDVVGDNENIVNQIISGCDADWSRLNNAGTCGFGDNLPSLDDLVSRKLMGETKGASENLIVFIPQPINEQKNFQNKVFAATELEQIFKNDTFQTINGIPKEQLKSIYDEGEAGKECVYNIIQAISSKVVGDEQTLDKQTELLSKAITDNGSLTTESNTYAVNKCYDENDAFVGVELISKNQEQPLIVAPESTVRKEGFQSGIQQSGKEIDILQPNAKLSLFQDIDGTIRIGTKPKLTLKQGLNGELILGTDAAKESAKQFNNIFKNEKIR